MLKLTLPKLILGRKHANQTANRGGQLRTHTFPVVKPVNSDSQTFRTNRSGRIIEPKMLNKTAITGATGIRNNNFVKGAIFGSTTG
jgi:hypothetical protein